MSSAHHPPPAGGTDLRHDGPTDEVPLTALEDLGVLGELLVTDLQNNLSQNRTVYRSSYRTLRQLLPEFSAAEHHVQDLGQVLIP